MSCGVGLRLRRSSNGRTALVVAVEQQSPAERTGFILPGDEIAAIDGKSVAGMSESDLQYAVFGPANTTVCITLGGHLEPKRDVQLRRTPQHLPSGASSARSFSSSSGSARGNPSNGLSFQSSTTGPGDMSGRVVSNEVSGVGLTLCRSRDGNIRVDRVTRDFLGAVTGSVEEGDIVSQINSQHVQGLAVKSVSNMILGPADTLVRFRLFRPRIGLFVDCTMKRRASQGNQGSGRTPPSKTSQGSPLDIERRGDASTPQPPLASGQQGLKDAVDGSESQGAKHPSSSVRPDEGVATDQKNLHRTPTKFQSTTAVSRSQDSPGGQIITFNSFQHGRMLRKHRRGLLQAVAAQLEDEGRSPAISREQASSHEFSGSSQVVSKAHDGIFAPSQGLEEVSSQNRVMPALEDSIINNSNHAHTNQEMAVVPPKSRIVQWAECAGAAMHPDSASTFTSVLSSLAGEEPSFLGGQMLQGARGIAAIAWWNSTPNTAEGQHAVRNALAAATGIDVQRITMMELNSVAQL